ncbi:MAG: hypothetical protein IJK28_05355 [Clostridia bacterium]|nr:hypothetical protein [Clostridia bacterium]
MYRFKVWLTWLAVLWKRILGRTAAVILAAAALVFLFRVVIPDFRYRAAAGLRDGGHYTEAEEAFAALGDYRDAATQAKEARYRKAMALIAGGDSRGAVGALSGIQGYRDTDSLLKEQTRLAEAAAAREARVAPFRRVGSTVTFGRFEQDGNAENGPEAIEWTVLEAEDGKALLMALRGLDARPYHEEHDYITWERCTLRKWLNGDFFLGAFTEEERRAVLLTEVDNSLAQGFFRIESGADTKDRVFLLSYAEMMARFPVKSTRVCAPTEAAVAAGAWVSATNSVNGRPAGWWWLRSPGSIGYDAVYVDYHGEWSSHSVDRDNVTVRPVIRIDLNAECL